MIGKKGTAGGTIKDSTRRDQDMVDAIREILGLDPLYRAQPKGGTDYVRLMLSRSGDFDTTNKRVSTKKPSAA